jgi:porin
MHHVHAGLCASVALAAAALHAEEGADREWFGGLPLHAWSGVTGDWAGARTALADAGVTVDGSLVVEASRVLRAGVDDGKRTGLRSQVNLGAGLDLDVLIGVPKAELRIDAQYAGGDDAGIAVGDAQGWSNISVADDLHQISELWFQQRFGAVGGDDDLDLLRIKLGKIDANSEFATAPALGQFLNSSAGFSPTIFCLPTYPDPAVGINAFVQPVAGAILGLGYYDASATTRGTATGARGAGGFFASGPDTDKLWLAQVEGHWDGGLAQVGGWLVRGELVGVDDATRHEALGWYAVAQHDAWSDGAERSITGVAQVAGADADQSEIALHTALGVWAQGLIDARPADGFGVYATQATFTDATDGAGERLVPAQRETAFEGVYAAQVTGWWLLRADAQYIRHPGGGTSHPTALVVAVRSDITF